MDKIKAILFDMDGVLVDSEPLHFEAHQKSLAHFGIGLSSEDYLEFGVATGDRKLYEKAAEKFAVAIDKKEISKLKKKIYREIIEERGRLMDGVLETLEYLKDKYDLAIVSSGVRDINEFVMHKFNLEPYFKIVITGDDVERVKPFPDVYLKALETLGRKKEECVAIEDSQTGLDSAKSAGIACIVIPNNFTKAQDFSHADRVIADIKELRNYVIKS